MTTNNKERTTTTPRLADEQLRRTYQTLRFIEEINEEIFDRR
jgi:hypothetical protein